MLNLRVEETKYKDVTFYENVVCIKRHWLLIQHLQKIQKTLYFCFQKIPRNDSWGDAMQTL